MTVQMTRTGPASVTFTRIFAAPPARVWAAHMDPALLRQWLAGGGDMIMPVCENDARPGGQLRYEWHNPATGHGFHVTGTFELIDPPHRAVHTEIMHLSDPMPELRVDSRFQAHGSGTRLTMTMTAADAAALEQVIAAGLTETDHMDAGYDRLETALSAPA